MKDHRLTPLGSHTGELNILAYVVKESVICVRQSEYCLSSLSAFYVLKRLVDRTSADVLRVFLARDRGGGRGLVKTQRIFQPIR